MLTGDPLPSSPGRRVHDRGRMAVVDLTAAGRTWAASSTAVGVQFAGVGGGELGQVAVALDAPSALA